MTTIPQITAAMKHVLETAAEQAARPTGFVQRTSKLSASAFCQTLVFGWMNQPDASLNELTQVAAALGVPITPQGLDDRFNERAAGLLEKVLGEAVTQLISSDPVRIPLLNRFNGVYLCDSTVISLPASLAAVWPGLGNNRREATAALKIHVRFNFSTGAIDGFHWGAGRQQDRSSPTHRAPLPKGALRLADLGYFDIQTLAAYDHAAVYFLSRLRVGTTLLDEAGQRLALATLLAKESTGRLDCPVYLGKTARLSCRLLASRVPPEVAAQRRRRIREQARIRQKPANPELLRLADWTILVTNIPPTWLSLDEALVVLGVRWQIELLFKLWKSHSRVDESRSQQPWRILCEVYAKLIGVLIQHWILLTACWRFPDRSLTKAVQTVQSFALALAAAFAHPRRLSGLLQTMQRCLRTGNRMNKRKKKRNTYQLLLAGTYEQ